MACLCIHCLTPLRQKLVISSYWEVGTMERQRNYMDPKWMDSCLLKTSFSLPAAPPPHVRIRHSPNSFSPMGEITSTISLYLLWKNQRVWEPDAVFKTAAQWMNKDREHVRRKKHLFWQMCPKFLLYNLVDDQHLEKHVFLIQPWVNSKHSVCVLPPLLNACHACSRGRWYNSYRG